MQYTNHVISTTSKLFLLPQVKYRGSLDCLSHILREEGARSLFRGAGVNVVRGVAGAGVLSGFDKFKNVYVGWRMQHQQL
jgi:solute carrier family 25 (adenine nucleotide translocator) protein 4/5/6/31